MQWYHYFSGFWAGIFFANFIPHFVKGISGDAFPTPFANPPGKGLSSPIINVSWALFNLVIAYVLFKRGKVSTEDNLSILIFFVGFVCISIMLAINFTNKDKV